VSDAVGDTQWSAPITPTVWHHLAVWWDATSKTKRIYVDGVLNSGNAPVDFAFDDDDVTIGADVDNGGTFAAYVGRLDDVRVYDHPLDASELAALQTP
jgi:hypothetical protein